MGRTLNCSEICSSEEFCFQKQIVSYCTIYDCLTNTTVFDPSEWKGERFPHSVMYHMCKCFREARIWKRVPRLCSVQKSASSPPSPLPPFLVVPFLFSLRFGEQNGSDDLHCFQSARRQKCKILGAISVLFSLLQSFQRLFTRLNFKLRKWPQRKPSYCAPAIQLLVWFFTEDFLSSILRRTERCWQTNGCCVHILVLFPVIY